ncbi:hypothetical protein AB8Z38_06820 [Bradyrhizobium sp. LLZ17]|uniref:Uncharacterized protein n=1 Tax=Bradyrhizobium sp. LLZ17 TaxID=3239388 RepID=A0AB39XMI1_9BRAD
MRENKRKTLRALLIFLGRIMDDKSKLPPTRRNAAIAQAARTESRGWRYLAGEPDDINELLAVVGEAPSLLLRNRIDPDSNHRPIGSKDEKYAAKDAEIIAEIRGGKPKPAAIYARFKVRKQYGTHARRIKRKMDEQDAETRRIVALQTPNLHVVDNK